MFPLQRKTLERTTHDRGGLGGPGGNKEGSSLGKRYCDAPWSVCQDQPSPARGVAPAMVPESSCFFMDEQALLSQAI